MSDVEKTRMFTGHTTWAGIKNGAEWRSPESPPLRWRVGDEVVFILADNDRVTLHAEPSAGADTFAYYPNASTKRLLELERLPPDSNGRAGLRVRFDE